jgi:hypothetical protein
VVRVRVSSPEWDWWLMKATKEQLGDSYITRQWNAETIHQHRQPEQPQTEHVVILLRSSSLLSTNSFTWSWAALTWLSHASGLAHWLLRISCPENNRIQFISLTYGCQNDDFRGMGRYSTTETLACHLHLIFAARRCRIGKFCCKLGNKWRIRIYDESIKWTNSA